MDDGGSAGINCVAALEPSGSPADELGRLTDHRGSGVAHLGVSLEEYGGRQMPWGVALVDSESPMDDIYG